MPETPSPAEENGLYPIRAVAQMTGINPITLRAWERRYGLIQPVRTESGHRLYSKRDVERIQQIITLCDQGVALAKVASLLDSPTTPPLVSSPHTPSVLKDVPLDGLLSSAVEQIDDIELERFYRTALDWLAPQTILIDWLYPAAERLAQLRQQSSLDELRYHWLASQLQHLTLDWLSKLPMQPGAQTVVIGTLVPDRDTLATHRLAIEIKLAGLAPRIFAQPTSLETLLTAQQHWHGKALVLIAKSKLPTSIFDPYTQALAAMDTPIILIGSKDNQRNLPPSVQFLTQELPPVEHARHILQAVRH